MIPDLPQSWLIDIVCVLGAVLFARWVLVQVIPVMLS
jgi:hypothetical protein